MEMEGEERREEAHQHRKELESLREEMGAKMTTKPASFGGKYEYLAGYA